MQSEIEQSWLKRELKIAQDWATKKGLIPDDLTSQEFNALVERLDLARKRAMEGALLEQQLDSACEVLSRSWPEYVRRLNAGA